MRRCLPCLVKPHIVCTVCGERWCRTCWNESDTHTNPGDPNLLYCTVKHIPLYWGTGNSDPAKLINEYETS